MLNSFIFFLNVEVKVGHLAEEHRIIILTALKLCFVRLHVDIIETMEERIEFGKTSLFGNYFY